MHSLVRDDPAVPETPQEFVINIKNPFGNSPTVSVIITNKHTIRPNNLSSGILSYGNKRILITVYRGKKNIGKKA